ncbi:MAG: hypothetical protein K1W22_03075 [Lachnospiraceae bacterium]
MSIKNDPFREYDSEKIALYGLGTETKKALLSLEGRYEIIGLLDSFREEGELYGKDILPLSQAFKRGAKLIIVVARPGSCKAIAKKIGDICREHEVALMDIRGKDLLEKKIVAYDFSGIHGGTKEELCKKIAQADIVSFDLFDTLIMRDVLSPVDIIELTDAALKEKGVPVEDFVSRRLEAEKRLAKYGAPTLEELYGDILGESGNPYGEIIGKNGGTDRNPMSVQELAATEWEIDYKSVLARQAMCDIFASCVRRGKPVYIVTDTYYRREQIERILEKCHLTGYTGLLISCEYHTGKTQKLFERLKEITGECRCLHIGDDLTADIEMAAKAGMDTYHIFSGEELLDAVGNMGMAPYMDNLPERLKTGMFAARLFNNPFQFESEDRRIALPDAYDIGYLVCAPIITDFVFWFREQVRRYGLRNIWFSARDGYLLQKLYRMLETDTDTVYFLTSRTAAIRACVMNDADIAYVDSMKFGGTLEENLKVRFGLEINETEKSDEQKDSAQAVVSSEEVKQQEEKKSGLLMYKDHILEHVAVERRRYQTYINSLNIQEGDIAFFDFVAKGTTQMYVQRLVGHDWSEPDHHLSYRTGMNHHLKGFYFLQLEPDFMKDKGLDIEPFYKAEETEAGGIYEYYYVLETILTAPHPCVSGFDDAGEPVYAKDSRSKTDIRCFLRAQEGIQDYFRRYQELLPSRYGNAKNLSKKLDEVILGLIANLKIEDDDFMSLVVEDSFFNRMTGMTELI